MHIRSFGAGANALAIAMGFVTPAIAQDTVGATGLTIYSTTQPGSVPPDLYRPVPGQGTVPG